MTTHRVADILLGHIRNSWTHISDRIVGLDALERLDLAELRRLAADTGMTPAELEAALRADGRVAGMLEAMLIAHGLDAKRLSAEQPAAMRALEVSCSNCHMTGRCMHELKVGTAAENAEHFCPNADTLSALADRAAL